MGSSKENKIDIEYEDQGRDCFYKKHGKGQFC